jgi:hypothetical protein
MKEKNNVVDMFPTVEASLEVDIKEMEPDTPVIDILMDIKDKLKDADPYDSVQIHVIDTEGNEHSFLVALDDTEVTIQP